MTHALHDPNPLHRKEHSAGADGACGLCGVAFRPEPELTECPGYVPARMMMAAVRAGHLDFVQGTWWPRHD